MKSVDIIRARLSQREVLAQLAEEAAELSHAALKLRRSLSGKNPTPVLPSEAMDNLREEIADVTVCLHVLGIRLSESDVFELGKEKLERWAERLTDARDCAWFVER